MSAPATERHIYEEELHSEPGFVRGKPINFRCLTAPVGDVSSIWNFGIAGVPFAQYFRWADDLNIFVTLADRDSVTLEEIASLTPLSTRGADALLGVLCALKILIREGDTFRLSDLGREFFDRRSAFYIGPSFYGMLKNQLPPRLKKGDRVKYFSSATDSLWQKFLFMFSPKQMGRPERLLVQHSRNFASAVVAVNNGLFKDVQHLLDIGGGSGVFAIPLALAHRDILITLVELPRALPHIAGFLERFEVSTRVALLGLNVHALPWRVPNADGILFGNFLHFCSDDECRTLLKEAHRILPLNGRLFIHEMLWDDNKDGPLVTALWNFWMISVSGGQQRTEAQLHCLLGQAGFSRMYVKETSGSFSMLVYQKLAG